MAYYEIDFCIIRDEGGKIIGFSVVAQPQTEAEMFCGAFPKALFDNKADIIVEEETIVFKASENDKCSFDVGRQDAEILDNFLHCRGDYQGERLNLCRDGILTPGFKIVLKGMNDFGKKDSAIQPTRIRQ